MCTDGLACGPAGGFDLFEACCAYKRALGITDVIVRAGHCESVCPRDGAVTVRCPDQRNRVCAAPASESLVSDLLEVQQQQQQQQLEEQDCPGQ